MWSDALRRRSCQLALFPDDEAPVPPAGAEPDWRLDDRTCRLGRAGVAAARALLAAPPRRPPSEPRRDRPGRGEPSALSADGEAA